ncbi:helix-turn-helix transcriptional regulator [Halarcobacter sp.]|uniref:helix-turn-helix domain-containing protein n=1 Tax=Halarcobacter sp. TaxID=2321133 RepID=UPI002AAB73B7|nr:helix-turn-helix transcriptional regulator [Halarcobacter sp.]
MQECTITDEKMKEVYEQIGQNVARIRKERKMSQLSLSLAIGHKAVGTISMAEKCINGKHFNIEHLIKIADVLEVNVCEFFNSLVK